MKHTEETKRLLSDMRRGERNPFYGKKHSPEFIEQARRRMQGLNAARQYEAAPQKVRVPTGNDLAYLAGMIDADGSVRFRKGRPFVAVYNTSRPLIDWLLATMGHGSVSYGNEGRERVMAWCIQGARDVYALSTALLPLLIVKRGDAEAALAYLREKYEWAK